MKLNQVRFHVLFKTSLMMSNTRG